MGNKLTVVVQNIWDDQLKKYVTKWDDTTTTDWTVAANRAGKDFYIYAVEPSSGVAPELWHLWRQKGNDTGVVKLEWR